MFFLWQSGKRAPGLRSHLPNLPEPQSELLSDQTHLEHLVLELEARSQTRAPGAIENHTVGRWHIVPLQESAEFLQHEDIARQFHVAHFRSCAALFIMFMLESDLEVKVIYLQLTRQTAAGGPSRPFCPELAFDAFPGTASRASQSCRCTATTWCKKRSIASNVPLAVRTAVVQEEVDMVARDFNGASWRRKSGPEQQFDSTLEDAFKNAKLFVPLGSFPFVGFWWNPKRLDWCMCICQATQSLSRSGSYESTVRLKSIVKSWVSLQKTRPSHYKTWIHLSHVSTPVVERGR